ncbi:MAG: FxsA family protein [Immundisolibacter sp.]|uniref:FxsA family protein n=1 Tax=Immundisolibacter sp. TaxID=1934948 RepID=UPI003D0B12CC
MLRFLPVTLFVVLPLAELYTLLVVGAHIGALRTIALLILAGMGGAAVMRHFGARGLLQLRDALGRGQSPAQPMVEIALAQLAGLLLILPGFIGDAIALGLLLPPLRHWLARRLSPPMVAESRTEVHVIEGEFRRRDGN